jgi:preprotein translocase subunit YajC
MDLNWTEIIVAMAPPPAGTTQDPKAGTLQMVGFLVIMFVLLYFVMIRPQRKQQREHAEMLKNVKGGDRIVTNSGIVGAVVTVKEKTLTIRSGDAKFEITKSAIAQITERGGDSSES